MQLEIKKSKLEAYLLTISAINPETGKMISGLLNENIKLGTKRKLQKLHKELMSVYKEFLEDIKTIQAECGEDKAKLESEIKELIAEQVKIEFEPVELSSIEGVNSSTNYDFDIIEKIAI